ncbi:MAG: transglycosylase SLT domain-containing protein [bacterium]|nr:transglycosylase SLT domain-containing protein [bacterium]
MIDRYDLIIAEAAANYSVPFDWVKAFIGTESNFDPRAYRAEPQINDASRGLMQMLESTARDMGLKGDPDQLFDPGVSIDLGAKYMRWLIDKYGMVYEEIYSAYNSGGPFNYLSNTKVGERVRNAVDWLGKVRGNGMPSGVVMLIIIGAAAIAALKLFR